MQKAIRMDNELQRESRATKTEADWDRRPSYFSLHAQMAAQSARGSTTFPVAATDLPNLLSGSSIDPSDFWR